MLERLSEDHAWREWLLSVFTCQAGVAARQVFPTCTRLLILLQGLELVLQPGVLRIKCIECSLYNS